MSLPSSIDESVLQQRLLELAAAKNWEPRLLSTLETFIRTADDYDLFRINPLQYGGTAGLSDADAIELFVHAAKIGLFELDWQLLCAYCPQIAGSFRELDKVHPRFQCEFRDQAVLNLSDAEVEVVLDNLCALADFQAVYFLWRPCLPDANDDMILELAVAARVPRIVTFNAKDFHPASRFGIEVVTPKIMLEDLP